MADKDPGQDSLFREINEELRQEQFGKLWKTYGNYAIAVAVLAVVGVAGYQVWHNRDLAKRAEESAQFTTALRATMENRSAEATQAFTKLAETGSDGYALISKLDLAAIKSRDNNKAEAASAYLAIAGNKDTTPELRDLALLLSVLQEIDNGDPKALTDRVAPLVASANPWRFNAKEFTAYLAQRMGENQRAGQLFRELADDATAPQGIRARAAEMSAVLGS
ncbi:MAG: hypothetical protein K0Q70_1515 [Rhodospirillales bacterium]|jgi:hypothetical protein|nr:hypothetical protein [Rhodospirillales bacterium]